MDAKFDLQGLALKKNRLTSVDENQLKV